MSLSAILKAPTFCVCHCFFLTKKYIYPKKRTPNTLSKSCYSPITIIFNVNIQTIQMVI